MDKLIDSDSIKEFRRLIEESADIVLTCHVRPDGDAIGSTLGMMHLLRALGKNVTVIIPDKAPGNLSFLPGFKEMGVYTWSSGILQEDSRIGRFDNMLRFQHSVASGFPCACHTGSNLP